MEKKTLIEGIAVGAVAGAIAGILLAPKSGKETRDDVKAELVEVKDKLVERLEALEEFTQEKYDEVVRTLVAEVAAAKKLPAQTVKELEASLRDCYEALRQTIHEHTAPTEKALTPS
jgi:gas vesicle protein